MPPQARKTDVNVPETEYEPTPIITGSEDTFTNSLSVARVSDKTSVHCLGSDCHGSYVAEGSLTVFTNSLANARIGDPIACGQIVGTGSYNKITG